MQNKPVNPQSPMDQGQLDAQAMNNMYLQFFQMQQQMYQPVQHWNMNNQDSDNLSIQENRSYKLGSHSPPKTNSFMYENGPEDYGQQEPHFLQTADNPNVWTSHQYSEGSHRQEPMEDDWSTRPRAKNHLSKFDLRNLPNQEGGDKKSKGFGSGFEINIRNVEELLDDDDQIHHSGFSGHNLEAPNKKVRSVENSAFNSGFGKTGSGWSDTLGSKLNKTKTTRDSGSTPFQRSFGEPRTPNDLTTIFETKGGPFFAWDDQPHQAKREEYFEGFKVVEGPKSKKQHTSFNSELLWENPNVEAKYYSNFMGDSTRPSLFPIISNESEEDKSQADKQKSNSEF